MLILTISRTLYLWYKQIYLQLPTIFHFLLRKTWFPLLKQEFGDVLLEVLVPTNAQDLMTVLYYDKMNFANETLYIPINLTLYPEKIYVEFCILKHRLGVRDPQSDFYAVYFCGGGA